MVTMDMVSRFFNQAIAPLKTRVLLTIGRGLLLAVNDSTKIQQVSISLLAGETKDKTESFQNYGFTSNPPKDTEIIMLSVGGNRDHGIVVASEHRGFRLKNLDEGDSAQYNKNGKKVHLEGDNLKIIAEKLVVNNASHEFTAVVVEYMKAVRDGKVITLLGPSPFDAATITALNAIIVKMETFKL